MLVLLQAVAIATVPLNVTALAPCVAPKFVPVITTAVPMAPELGPSELIVGAGGGVAGNGVVLLELVQPYRTRQMVTRNGLANRVLSNRAAAPGQRYLKFSPYHLWTEGS